MRSRPVILQDCQALAEGPDCPRPGGATDIISVNFQSLQLAWRQFSRRPALPVAVVAIIAVFCGVSATQVSMLRAWRDPAVPAGLGSLHYVRLLPKDLRSERRLPLGLALEAARSVRNIAQSAVYRTASLLIDDQGWTDSLAGVYAQPGLLRLFEVAPLLGHAPEDLAPSERLNAAYISHRLWRRMPDPDRDFIGRPVLIAGEPCVVRGVLPPGAEIPDGSDIIRLTEDFTVGGPGGLLRPVDFLVRVRDGASLRDLSEELNVLLHAPGTAVAKKEGVRGIELTPFAAFMLGPAGQNLLSGLVVITFCFSLALLTSAAVLVLLRAREHEPAQLTKVVLGAEITRLVGEGLVAACAWVFAAVPLGYFVGAVYGRVLELAFALAQKRAFWLRFEPDSASLLALAGVALAVLALCQLASVLRLDLNDMGRHQRTVTRHQRSPATAVFAASQFFVCFMLVAVTVLLTHAGASRDQAGQSIDQQRIITCRLALPAAISPDLAGQTALLNRLQQEVSALPGVAGVTFARRRDYVAGGTLELPLLAADATDGTTRQTVSSDTVRYGYFSDLGVRLIDGREFTSADAVGGPMKVLVNQAFVRRYSPDRLIVGTSLTSGNPIEIIGVVPDLDLGGSVGSQDPPEGVYFLMDRAGRQPYLTMLVRYQVATPAGFATDLRRAVIAAHPGLAPYWIKTVAESIDEQYATIFTMRRTALIYAVIVGGITSLALISVVLFQFRCSHREIALRIALGAGELRAFLPMCRWLWASSLAGIAAGSAMLWILRSHADFVGLDRIQNPALLAAGGAATILAAVLTIFAVLPSLVRVRTVPVGRILAQ